jgi:hypothetical protein
MQKVSWVRTKIYRLGLPHRSKGAPFNNHDGTCRPEGASERNAETDAAAEPDPVAVLVPKLVIRQLQALLTLFTSAEQPPRKVGKGIVLDAMVVYCEQKLRIDDE